MTQTKKPSKPKTAAKKPVKTAKKTAVKKPERKTKKPDEPPKVLRYCSFCRKSQNEVLALIAGSNNIFICDNCVELCMAILLDDEKENPNVNWRERMVNLVVNPKKFNILIEKGMES